RPTNGEEAKTFDAANDLCLRGKGWRREVPGCLVRARRHVRQRTEASRHVPARGGRRDRLESRLHEKVMRHGRRAMTDRENVIHPKLEAYIATRDKRISKYWPHDRTHIRNLFVQLLEKGAVTVGGRSICGGSDPSMHAYRAWNEVVRKARALGYQITEEQVRGLGNSWATRGGGFWNETEYKLEGIRND